MLIAQTRQQIYINSLDYSRTQLKKWRQQVFYCPVCHEQVTLKIGTTIQPHFAHLAHSKCTVTTEGETAEHLAGKALLGEFCRHWQVNFEYEVYLPSIKQRPDLLVSTGVRHIAIEFQCSPLSIERLRERTSGYRRIGYEVVWILGQRYQRQHWTASNHAFLQYSRQWGWYQWQLDVSQHKLWLLHHIVHYGYPQQVGYQRCSVEQIKSLYKTQHQQLTPTKLLAEAQQLYRCLVQSAPELLSLQQSCYLAGHHLAGAPLCCHQASTLPINQQASILLAVRLLLFCEKQGCVTAAQLEQFCWTYATAFYQLPLVNEHSWQLQWCRKILQQWQCQDVLRLQGAVLHYHEAKWYPDHFSKQKAIKK